MAASRFNPCALAENFIKSKYRAAAAYRQRSWRLRRRECGADRRRIH